MVQIVLKSFYIIIIKKQKVQKNLFDGRKHLGLPWWKSKTDHSILNINMALEDKVNEILGLESKTGPKKI